MNADAQTHQRESRAPKKKPPRPRKNPIETAITTWHAALAPHLKDKHDLAQLIAEAPKRWTAYGPLALLPTGSFTSQAWRAILEAPNPTTNSDTTENKAENNNDDMCLTHLWTTLLSEITPSPTQKLTHLAINEGIPLHAKTVSPPSSSSADADEKAASPAPSSSENILRSPSGLRILHGDFGPPANSTTHDFARAFWVSTKQNGITQVWAPRWTMFSRGNVTEKARVLGFEPSNDNDNGGKKIAVDLYAGIGYFAFCYATLGFRVLCWELNPWSVEGLRRGAEANGWCVRVVEGPEIDDDGVLRDVLAGGEQLVVFLEDNARAAARLRRLEELSADGDEARLRLWDVAHVNCGLLPTCRDAWGTAWQIAAKTRGACIHIHENVGVADIDERRSEIEEWFAVRAGPGTCVSLEHVERVKTFAPGVWHCVFDVCVERNEDGLIDENIT